MVWPLNHPKFSTWFCIKHKEKNVGAVKNITIISIISAAVLGVFKKFTMGKKCFGIKVKRKHFWKMKQKSIGLLLNLF